MFGGGIVLGNVGRRAAVVVAGLFFLFLVYCFAETYFLDVVYVDLVDSRIPVSLAGKRIVLFSDVHYGPFFGVDRVRNVVLRVNQLGGDYIVLAGDYVDELGGRDYESVKPCFDELRGLNSSVPKYGVLGNHDYWVNAGAVRRGLLYAGITPIDDVCVNLSVDGSAVICGVGGLLSSDTDSGRVYRIVVSHNPDYAEQLGGRVDLVLSGHTHGGQITFFGLWAPYLPSRYGQKYRSGLVDNGFTRVYVTRGVGQTWPLRFFARPEITVITFRAA